MYGSSSNNGSNNCAETSISGEDEEKRSQAYSSQTDYAMVGIRVWLRYSRRPVASSFFFSKRFAVPKSLLKIVSRKSLRSERTSGIDSHSPNPQEIAPNGRIAHSTGLSTLLLDENITQMADFYDNGFFHSNGRCRLRCANHESFVDQ